MPIQNNLFFFENSTQFIFSSSPFQFNTARSKEIAVVPVFDYSHHPKVF